jgi:hypothetical protein
MERQPMHWNRIALVTLVLAVVPVTAEAQQPTQPAQQPTRRRQAPIEIRGQVPTPQVVTVRPRALPTYSRQVLVPRFFDHDFWPDIQLGYQLVPERQINGRLIADTLHTAADSLTALRPDTTRARMDSPRTDSTRARAAPVDTLARKPGTPPAR